MVHDILANLDNNSKGEIQATIATFYDWSKAFDMQCHRLGIQSFIDCGVRTSLLPILVNYFQGRTMTVKYRGETSSVRNFPGGGAQGTLIGPIEYACQSNNSADSVDVNQRYKFVDDLTTIEIVDLVMNIASYNFRNHVASDIGIHGQIIPPEQTKTQEVVKTIDEWTTNQKMKLNSSKTKYMIVNFTNNYQFNTRISLNDTILTCIDQIRLLGVEVCNDLSWKANTSSIVKKAFGTLTLLRKLVCFGVTDLDLVNIYILFIRSKLEYNCVVWHSTITIDENLNFEEVKIGFCYTYLAESNS